MEKGAIAHITMIMSQKQNKLFSIFGFLSSLGIIAFGQPARLGWLGALASVLGFAIFFCTLPSQLAKKTKFLISASWFAVVQMIQLSWMTSIEFQGYYVIAVYSIVAIGLALQFGLLSLFVPSEGKISSGRILLCASIWTMMEWMRLFVLCGFSWNPVGLSLTHFIPALQFTSLFGVYGLSFWVMMTNLWAVNVWRMGLKRNQTIAWASLACFPYFFGMAQLAHHFPKSKAEQNKLNVALIQTALLPTEKSPHAERIREFIPPFEQWRKIFQFLKEKQRTAWDLIVLPEAAVPLLSDLSFYRLSSVRELMTSELGNGIEQKFPSLVYPYAEERNIDGVNVWLVSNLFLCQTLANHYQAEVVAGLDHSERKEGKNYNSAFCLSPNSHTHQRYDKQVLLPLAEYLPFDFLRPLTKKYGIFDFFTPGTESKVFGSKIPFSVAICYEETFAEIMRDGRDKGAKLFINVTNDNYYPHSTLHEQHFYHARLRAVENGTPLVRACNSGVTAAIDSLGRTLGRFNPETRSTRAQEGALSCHLTAYQYFTLFSFWGEAGIISICMIITLCYYRLRKNCL